MARDPNSDRPSLDPQIVATQTFSTTFRGFDTAEVRGYLEVLAGLMADASAREEDLARRLAAAEELLANPPPLDEHQLTVLLGGETTRVLDAARHAASEIRSNSEENAARLVREANEQATALTTGAEEYATRLRSEAEEETSAQRASADEYASRIRGGADDEIGRQRAAAEADAERIRGEAEAVLAVRTEEAEQAVASVRAEADRLRADLEAEVEARRTSTDEELAARRAQATAEADAEIEAARLDGREMVAEARAVRGRMLSDLSDRRRAARVQLDELRATRQWLLEMFDAAGQRIANAAEHLTGSTPAARLTSAVTAAGDAAADAAAADEVARQDAEDDAVLAAMIAEEPEPEGRRRRATSSTPREPEGEASDEDPVVDLRDPEPRAASDEPSASPAAPEPGPDQAAGSADEPGGSGTDQSATDGGEVEESNIDALFAKIRASRSNDVERAHEVLDQAPQRDTVKQTDTGPVETDPSPGHGPDEVASLLERRDAATDQIERQLARRLKRILSDEQNDLLDQVRRAKGVPKADAILPDLAAHAGRYAEAAAGDLAGAARAGASFYGSVPAEVSTAIDDIAAQLADELVRQLRGRLGRCFSDAEGDESELGERIRACYREWKTQRIADTSRHFVLAAFTRGLFDAAPVATSFRWIVDDGGTPCPDAEDNALQGEVAKGDTFPTGHAYPPAHPGCRCLIVPVEVAVASPG